MMRTKIFETSPEKRIRRILSFAVEGTLYWVNSQTPIEAIIEADDDDPPEERSMIRNGTFDCTIHREAAPSALWVVEYDGPTHDKPDQVRRDIVKNRICGNANLPLLRIGYREDDDFLTAVEKLAPLRWLVLRWIAYESKIEDLTRSSERWVAELTPEQRMSVTFEEASPEFHFDLAHVYPPLKAIASRLLNRYGIDVDLPDEAPDEPPEGIKWRAITPWGGPLPDLEADGFLSGHTCEVEIQPANDPTNDAVFVGRGEFTTRFAYPIRAGQRSPFDLRPPHTEKLDPVLSGPPWGGSPARIGGEIAWYRALKQVEHWAERNLIS